jgi:NAD(P)-dependent dehydrogenase (short-subunit alcohol dehydrogenase family)
MSTDMNWEFAATSYTKTYHRKQYTAIDPSNPDISASGKVVVVTGGGKGIGKSIAEAFVKAGAKAVAILGRRTNVLEEAKKDLEAAGSTKILTYEGDVVDENALDKAFAGIKSEVGPVDVVVANAAFAPDNETILKSTVDDWWRTYEVNVKGTLLLFRAFAANNSGKDPVFISMLLFGRCEVGVLMLVGLNTGASHGGIFPTMSAYSTSKLATVQLIRFFAAENPEIRSVSYHPGVLETDMSTKGGPPPWTFDDMSLPAGYAVWLASSKASFTQGLMLWAHW